MSCQSMVKCEIQNNIAILTIDNPPVNSLTDTVLAELDACLTSLAKNEDARVAILTGSGRSFVAGADIKEFSEWTFDELVCKTRYGQKVLSGLEALPIPVIAAINGFALGGGLETALACDIRIASEKAKLGLPEATLGIIPGYGGLSRLSHLIGEAQAKRLIFTAEIFDAQRALELGIVQEVVAPEQLMDFCLALAGKIAAVAPLSVRKVKEGVLKRRDCNLTASLENEVLYSMECFYTEDRKEGIAAFLEKRQSIFTNK